MNKIRQVALYEYRRNVLKKSFLFVLLSLPFLVALSIGLGLYIESVESDPRLVGYVDDAGVFDNPVSLAQANFEEPVEFAAFSSRDEALRAIEAQEITAFYVLEADYRQTREVEFLYSERPSSSTTRRFFDFLQLNLVTDVPPEIASRVAKGAEVTVRTPDGRLSVPTGGPTFGSMMPLFINLAFLGMMLISSGYLMGAVAEEKENRTMEILVTSISPAKMILGKVAGILGIALTLLLVWSAITGLGISAAAALGVGWFQDLNMDWRAVVGTAGVALPAFLLVAALMAGIGAMSTTTQESQSISAVFIILHLLPLYIAAGFIHAPNSPLATILSLLPFTALMTIAVRHMVSVVPPWQMAASAGVQLLCALGALWLAGRALRMGMLSYGQRLSLRRLFLLGIKKSSGGSGE